MTASIGLALLLRGSVVVGGTAACPAPAVVQALIPKGSSQQLRREPDRAELIPMGGGLRVRLLDNRGRLLAERQLDTTSSCASLAEAAAVVIVAMELEVWAVPGVDEVPLPPRESKAPAAVAAGGSVVRANPSPHASPLLSFNVGPTLLGTADSSGRLTWVGGLTLALDFSRSRFRPEAGLFVEGLRDMPVDNGTVSYQRFWFSAGVGYELGWGRWSIEPQAELLGAALRLKGDGVTSVATALAGDFGGQAGLTAHWTLGLPTFWAGVFILGWPGGTQVQIGRPSQSRALPSWEGLLGLGIGFGT